MTGNDMTGPELLERIRLGMAEKGLPDEARVEQVHIPDVEIPLYVRTFSAEAWAALVKYERSRPRDLAGKLARLLAFGVCHADGGLLMSKETAHELPERIALSLAEHVIRVNPTDDPE